MGLVEFAGWLATQVFDVVGSFAGVQGADGGATVDLQAGLAAMKHAQASAVILVSALRIVMGNLFRACWSRRHACPAASSECPLAVVKFSHASAAGWQDCVP